MSVFTGFVDKSGEDSFSMTQDIAKYMVNEDSMSLPEKQHAIYDIIKQLDKKVPVLGGREVSVIIAPMNHNSSTARCEYKPAGIYEIAITSEVKILDVLQAYYNERADREINDFNAAQETPKTSIFQRKNQTKDVDTFKKKVQMTVLSATHSVLGLYADEKQRAALEKNGYHKVLATLQRADMLMGVANACCSAAPGFCAYPETPVQTILKGASKEKYLEILEDVKKSLIGVQKHVDAVNLQGMLEFNEEAMERHVPDLMRRVFHPNAKWSYKDGLDYNLRQSFLEQHAAPLCTEAYNKAHDTHKMLRITLQKVDQAISQVKAEVLRENAVKRAEAPSSARFPTQNENLAGNDPRFGSDSPERVEEEFESDYFEDIGD